MELTAELLSISERSRNGPVPGQDVQESLGWHQEGRLVRGKSRPSPLGGILKGIAKKALPFVGSALGCFHSHSGCRYGAWGSVGHGGE